MNHPGLPGCERRQ